MSENSEVPKANYDVGYKKPPKRSQFKPGQSGNPKGKPKGAKGLKTDLREEMAERVTINENGKRIKVTKQRLMIKALAQKAAKGDVKAAAQLVSLTIQSFGLEDRRDGKSQLSKHDSALLAGFEEHLSGDGTGPGNDEVHAVLCADEEESDNGDHGQS